MPSVPRTPSGPGRDELRPPASIDPELRRRLQDAADPDGFLPFDRFVEVALYAPGVGFYERGGARFGRAGHFYTAPHVHGLFGATLAHHFREIRAAEGSPSRFPILEVGPGDGTLAADIRDALRGSGDAEGSWEYRVVERSAPLRAGLPNRLGPEATGEIPWRFADSVATEGPFRGIVLANELLDAFPFRRLRWAEGSWSELGVVVPNVGPPVEQERRLEAGDLPEHWPESAPPGTVIEFSPTAEAWVRELSDHVIGGRVVILDYGAEEGALLSRGPAGTMEAIWSHRRVDPLPTAGSSDVSAWVNFSRLRRRAKAAGLHETFYGPLSEALLRWGIDEVRARSEPDDDATASVKLRLAQKSFLLGFSNFQVLELSPRVPSP